MKLAEALVERKAIKTKIDALKRRLYQNAQVQEGDQPTEPPMELLDALSRETGAFEALVNRINRTNQSATLANGMPIAEAIVKKEMLNLRHLVHVNMADKAVPERDRYSSREIKFVPAIDISAIRKEADAIAKAYRELDLQIQAANWDTDLQ